MSPSNTASSTASHSEPIAGNDSRTTRRRPILFLSTLLLPILVFPYFITRRQIRPLRRKMELIGKDVQRLRTDLDIAVSNLDLTASELRHLKTAVQKNVEDMKVLRDRTSIHEADLVASDKALKDLRLLLNNAKWSSDSQMSALHTLGMSLAEVAAFMQEIERNLGLQTSKQSQDQRGIERLRLLALRMQTLQQASGSDNRKV